MKNALFFSLVAAFGLYAGEIAVEKVVVEEESQAEELYGEEVRFTPRQDLAKILFTVFPQIGMVRSGAIGNDIVVRGFKRDDINVLLDGAKIYGACPNRMDPPTMHISIADIEKIELVEGPFDVEHFGSMGGAIRVDTRDPGTGFGGEGDLILGSFGYNKENGTIFGGDENLAFALGVTRQNSDQYEDGDGRTLVEQNWAQLGVDHPDAYKPRYRDLEAYTRNGVRAKLSLHPASGHRLRLSFLSDKAKDVLYPAFMMDALLDSTTHLNGIYTIEGADSREFSLQAYHSRVRHDMGNQYRNSSDDPMLDRIHHTTSRIDGFRLKHRFQAWEMEWKGGVDASLRNWNGVCISRITSLPKQVRIPDVDTLNRGLFLEGIKEFGSWSVKVGLRYDATDIKAHNLDDPTIVNIPQVQEYYQDRASREYRDWSGYLFASYRLDEEQRLFVGVGEGVRVPDAQELYFISFMNGNWSRRGNPDLKESKNRQIDLGYEGSFGTFHIKGSLFYSSVRDYIYAYKSDAGNDPGVYYLTWTNVDVSIYGGDLRLFVPLGEFYMLEGSVAYQRGRKDEPIEGQSDRDMAMIPPLRGRVAFGYEDGDLFAVAELLASAGYEHVDSDNGEQEIGGWGVVNLRATKRVGDALKLHFGVENLFDRTYAVDNTYVGRALVGGEDPVLINEPGRFFYGALNFIF